MGAEAPVIKTGCESVYVCVRCFYLSSVLLLIRSWLYTHGTECVCLPKTNKHPKKHIKPLPSLLFVFFFCPAYQH